MPRQIKQKLKKISLVVAAWRLLLRIKQRIKQTIFRQRASYLIDYFVSRIYWRLSQTVETSCAEKSKSGIKKAVLIYSKFHFNPDNYNPKYTNHSAGGIARHVYHALATDKEVLYLDQNEPLFAIPRADLIVGIVSQNFIKIARANRQAKKILFLVNSHPLYRAEILLKESRMLNKKLPRQEWASLWPFFKCQQFADKIILIGNNFVRQTYTEQGVDTNRLFLINSGVNLNILQPDFNKRPDNKLRIVYVASDLGIRKGLFRVMQYWKHLNSPTINNAYELVIMGSDASFKNELQKFTNKFSNIKCLGWVDSIDLKYKEILQSGHIILFPSLEEGQVGTVLEAMACGCVPIITEQCGIPIQDGKQGFIIKDYTDSTEIEKYIKTLQNNPELLLKMSKEARKYVEENHNWEQFRDKITKIVTT